MRERLKMRFGIWGAAVAVLMVSAPLAAQGFNDGLLAAQAGDYRTAAAVWEPLAANDDAEAQFNMGLMYHKGLGVAADEDHAVSWYLRAAGNGHPRAQEFLAVAYREGWFGLPRDPRLAEYWTRRLERH